MVVSTEPTVNPPASGPLNTKLCLVNTAVCLDSFYKSSLLKCNTGRGGKEGPRCGRAEGGLLEVGLGLQTSLQAYLHAHKEEKRGFSRTFDKGLRLIGWQRQQKSVTVFISIKAIFAPTNQRQKAAEGSADPSPKRLHIWAVSAPLKMFHRLLSPLHLFTLAAILQFYVRNT